MSALDKLEAKLDELLVKNAPFQLPDKSCKTIVTYLPWVNLILGLISLWSAWMLWHWSHLANSIVLLSNDLSAALGEKPIVSHRLTTAVWLGLIVLVVEGLLFLVAFPSTRQRKKNGWNLLFYAALVNIIYGIAMLFSDYGGLGKLITSLLVTFVGLYILFQIRSYYTGRRATASTVSKS